MNTETVSLSGGGLEKPATGQNAGDWFESIDTSGLQENERLALWSLTSASESDGGKAQGRPPEADLSPKQLLALQALVAGKGITKAAFAAGVNRTTLFRWRTEQPAFNAAMTAWIDTTMQSAQSLLMESIETAARAVVDAAENGDAYIGLEMLRGVGLIRRSRDRSPATGKESAPAAVKPGEGMGGGAAATPVPPSIPPG